MPDRRENAELRGRLQAIQTGYEKWTKYTVRLLTILFLIQLGLGALSVYLVGQNQDRAKETTRLLRQVQASRVNATLTTCREQNDRHDNTIDALNAAVVKLKPTLSAEDRANLKQSIAANVSLIDALAPKQDCKKRVERLVGGTDPATLTIPAPPPPR